MNILEDLLITDDEKSYLANAKSWIKDEDDIMDVFAQLGFHGLRYYSELKPLFLFDFKNKGQLSLFNSIHVRDGALGLASFFLENPRPQRGMCKLLVAHHLNFLVPKEWRDYVFYYQIKSSQKAPRDGELILTGYLHPFCTPLEKIKKLLPVVKDNHIGQTYLLPSLHQPRDEANMFDLHPHFIDVQNLLFEYFPNLKGLSWNEYQKLDHSQAKLVELDQKSFMWSDSYVTHFHRAHGGEVQTFSEKRYEILAETPLSPYHSLQVTSLSKSHAASNFYNDLHLITDEIFQEKKIIETLKDKSNYILGEPSELSSYVYHYLRQNMA